MISNNNHKNLVGRSISAVWFLGIGFVSNTGKENALWSLHKKFPYLTWVWRGLHKTNLTDAFPHFFFFSIQFILLKFFYKKYFCSVLGQHFGNSTNIYACIFAASLTTVSLVIQKIFASTNVRKLWIYSRTYHDL